MYTSLKSFGRGRAVALVLTAVVAAGLVLLHVSGAPTHVSVPASAHAGQLTMKECTYANQAADCGTLVVRENRHDPRSRLIALPVTRIRSHAARPGAPVFRLQGGPGLTNMDFPTASRFTARHDVVLVGYRGVDGSSRLDCREVVDARAHSSDLLSASSFASVAKAYRACATRLEKNGVDLAGYSLPERVDDLESARRAFGDGRIDLLSESAGTRTAMIYAWRYPKSIHRSVMIGVNPPGKFLWDAKTTGDQVDRYAALCAQASDCRSRTTDLSASVHSAVGHIPSHWWFLPIQKGNVQVASFFGLVNVTSDGGGPIAAPRTLDTLLSIDEGDGAGAWLLSVFAGLAFPSGQVWGDVAAVARTDAAYAKTYFARHADRGSVLGAPGTDLLFAGGKLVHAWPANPDENEYTQVRDSKVETLLIGGALDVATPPQNAARELLPHLSNGRQVVLPKLGHADDFWAYEPAASTRLIDTYLDHGRVDTSLYTENQLDFETSFTHAMIAEIVLGVFLGLAGLTILVLLWIGARARRAATFGWKGSVAVRSLLPIVVGFGGYCLGVLIVLVAFPTVPVTDPLLAVLSTAVPVAVTVYGGWLRSGTSRRIAFATALGPALAGAWLGFHVPHAPGVGALTAIVGATLAANLGLITVDIAGVAEIASEDRLSTHTDPQPGRV